MLDKPVLGWHLAAMLKPRKILALSLVLALAGCATCFPSMESREQPNQAAQSGTIAIPGDAPAATP
jgi:hypothetical protein